MSKIIFAGGIHGVGKSTLFREIATTLAINYLSASEVLRWSELNSDAKNKKVVDIPDTQRRLLNGLQAIVKPDQVYLLDGHFSLFNKDGDIISVPMSTFEKMRPNMLVIITAAVAGIKNALERRDGRYYDLQRLSSLQANEENYAMQVSLHLHVPLFHFEQQKTHRTQLIEFIHENLA